VTTHLSYKGEGTHKTRVGGCCSIMIYSLVIPMIVSQLYPLAMTPDFRQQFSNHYIPHDMLSTFSMATSGQEPQAVLAVQIYSKDTIAGATDFSDYLMPVFYQQNGEEGDGTNVQAVPCLDLYPEGSENLDPFFALKTSSDGL